MAGSTPFPQDNVEQVFWHVLWWVQAGETPPLRSDSCFEEDKGQRRWGEGASFVLGKRSHRRAWPREEQWKDRVLGVNGCRIDRVCASGEHSPLGCHCGGAGARIPRPSPIPCASEHEMV